MYFLNFILSSVGCLLSLVTCWNLAWFLSSHDHLFFENRDVEVRKSGKDDPFTWKLCCDLGLVLLFCIQHTCMAQLKIFNFGSLQRTFYVICTSTALQVLMFYWIPVFSMPIWSLNTSTNPLLWWTFSLCHWVCWLAIYGGFLVMDMPNLLGLKQNGSSSSVQRKSSDLLRLYGHMRHPGFSALSLLLWCHPVMRLDRLLLSFSFPLYMLMAYRVDQKDHLYLKDQLNLKRKELRQIY